MALELSVHVALSVMHPQHVVLDIGSFGEPFATQCAPELLVVHVGVAVVLHQTGRLARGAGEGATGARQHVVLDCMDLTDVDGQLDGSEQLRVGGIGRRIAEGACAQGRFVVVSLDMEVQVVDNLDNAMAYSRTTPILF